MRFKFFCVRCFIWFAIALLTLSIPVAANRIENAWFPVIKDFVVLKMEARPGEVILSGVMHKARNCTFLGVAATAIYITGESDQVPMSTSSDASGNGGRGFTRATGTQAWGPWSVTIPVSPETVAIKMQLAHQCHLLWASQTDLGVIPIARAQK